MATATKKTAAKKTTRARADDWLNEPDATSTRKSARTKVATKKAAAKKAPASKTKASPAKTSRKPKEVDVDDEEDLEWGEVRKPNAKKASAKKYPKLALKPIKVSARTVGTGRTARKVKPRKLSATQVLAMVVEQTELPRAEVKLMLSTLSDIVKASIMPGAVGGAVVPGIGALMRKDIAAKKMPAVKRGTVIEKRNPRTGETTKYKHPGQKAYVKPGRTKVRSVPLAALRRAALGTE